jgi:hypothetical protein
VDYSGRKKVTMNGSDIHDSFPSVLQRSFYWWNCKPTEGERWIKDRVGRDFEASTVFMLHKP